MLNKCQSVSIPKVTDVTQTNADTKEPDTVDIPVNNYVLKRN